MLGGYLNVTIHTLHGMDNPSCKSAYKHGFSKHTHLLVLSISIKDTWVAMKIKKTSLHLNHICDIIPLFE